jgi:hypothetical protein
VQAFLNQHVGTVAVMREILHERCNEPPGKTLFVLAFWCDASLGLQRYGQRENSEDGVPNLVQAMEIPHLFRGRRRKLASEGGPCS